MATSKKKSVKRKVVKKKSVPVATKMTAKPSKAVLLKAAKLELRIAKATLVATKRNLIGAQKDYLNNPTNESAATFRSAPGLVIKANRQVEKESKNVLRCS